MNPQQKEIAKQKLRDEAAQGYLHKVRINGICSSCPLHDILGELGITTDEYEKPSTHGVDDPHYERHMEMLSEWKGEEGVDVPDVP